MSSSDPLRVNCHTSFRYRVAVQVPDAAGNLAPARVGQVRGVKLRLSANSNGVAIHANVDNLAATEEADEPSTFYVTVSKALHEAHVLPLGLGRRYYAIWSKAGEADFLYRPFIVGDRTLVTAG